MDTLFRWITCLAAGLIALVMGTIALQVANQAFPAIQTFGIGFLISTSWDPVNQVYGIFPQVCGTLITSLLALGLALPIALGVAVVLSEPLLPREFQSGIGMLVELLAAIPSVVYGTWGWLVLIPQVRPLGAWVHSRLGFLPIFGTSPIGPGVYVASLVLAVMILPIMAAIARDALRAVPSDMRQAAYSLGATRWEALLGVQIPIAAPGIIAGIILALGRALGETMAVTMLIGNARSVSLSVFSPGSTITSLLANQFTAAKQDQLPALMYATLVLFSLTLVVNLAAKIIQRLLNRRVMPTSAKPHQTLHYRKTSASEEPSVQLPSSQASIQLASPSWTRNPMEVAATLPIDTLGTTSPQQSNLRVPATGDCSKRLTRRSLLSHSLTGLAGFATAIAIVPLVAVLGYVIVNGVQYLNWQLLTQLPPPPLFPGGGIGNAIVGTLITVSIAILVSVPIGVLAALALSEVIPNSRFAAIVSFSADLLSGVPAIVIGMVVYSTIVLLTRSFSALAAGIALGILVVPTILQTATVALHAISEEVRWAAFAIGATTTQTSLQIVLPAALPGIATGVVLAISRAAGETAPVLFTALFSQFWFQPHLGLLQPIATLSVLIYTFATVPYPNLQALAWAASFVLVLLALLSTILTRCLYHPHK